MICAKEILGPKIFNAINLVVKLTLLSLIACVLTTIGFSVILALYSSLKTGSLEPILNMIQGILGIGIFMGGFVFFPFMLPGILLIGLPVSFFIQKSHRNNLMIWAFSGFMSAFLYSLILNPLTLNFEKGLSYGLYFVLGIGGMITGFLMWVYSREKPDIPQKRS